MRAEDLLVLYRSGRLTADEVKAHLRAMATSAADLPLTEGQRGLWALQRTYPESAAYNVPLGLRLIEPHDRAALREAVRWLGRRWPALGGRVVLVDGAPCLRPDGADLAVETQEAASWSEAAHRAWIEDRVRAPFDLERGPLLRGSLLHDGDETLVLLVVHHVIFDSSSFPLVMEAVVEAYQALAEGNVPAFPATDASGYLAYQAREQSRLTGAEGARRLAYWREVLSDLPAPLDLPTDHARGPAPSFAGASFCRALPASLGQEVRDFAAARGLFASTVLLGAWQGLLARLSGRDDLVVGMPVDQREAATQGLVGPFMEMLPVRSAGLGDGPFGEALAGLQRRLLDGMAQVLPFPALVRELGLGLGERSPVFETAFLYQDPVQPPAWELSRDLHQEGEYELALEVVAVEDGFGLHLKYDPTLFEA
ncbi:MAG: condensation domain-containing protein, partial [Alphaproteobacteria bacterium]|nr:condensation domain-containing protein [Alphaproteobacteria bacterium]